jgi:hypothetical protein
MSAAIVTINSAPELRQRVAATLTPPRWAVPAAAIFHVTTRLQFYTMRQQNGDDQFALGSKKPTPDQAKTLA